MIDTRMLNKHKSIQTSIYNILKDTSQPYQPNDMLNSKLSNISKSLIITYFEDTSVHNILNITFGELFVYVWNRIVDHKDKEELIKILDEEMKIY